MYELVSHGIPVVMSDLDAIWRQNAVQDLLAKPQGLSRGFDLIMSPGFFPFDVYDRMGIVGKCAGAHACVLHAVQQHACWHGRQAVTRRGCMHARALADSQVQ